LNIDVLETKIEGKRRLSDPNSLIGLPRRGVYFFFEDGEERTTSGSVPRVVRVGTHGLKEGAKSTLAGRLRQHCGNFVGAHPDGGNHRGSVFRKHIGEALIERDHLSVVGAKTWGIGSSAPKHLRDIEYPIEVEVSRYIRAMPFLWMKIDDEPSPNSQRKYVEKNSIALLSNYNHQDTPIDPPSYNWLGRWAKNSKLKRSNLWNDNHVDEDFNPDFLNCFKRLIEQAC
jgi:hypothetical protein